MWLRGIAAYYLDWLAGLSTDCLMFAAQHEACPLKTLRFCAETWLAQFTFSL